MCCVSFLQKVETFSRDYLKCCFFIQDLREPRYIFSKMLFSKLASTSQLLEDFLDFHGAKNNKNWFLYRELSAAVRHLSLSGHTQKHILNRLEFYELSQPEEFEGKGIKALEFITKCLRKIVPIILDEANRLNIPLPRDRFTDQDFPDISTDEMLPNDIDGKECDQQKQNIVRLASEFLGIASHFDQLGLYGPCDRKQISSIVPTRVNEVEIRRFEMQVHNMQSYFDTYVSQDGYRLENIKLKSFRGYFSVVFHLLQMVGRLLHFYERHLHEPGFKTTYKKVRNLLCLHIDPIALLDHTVNYGLYFICHFLNNGRKLVKDILNENIERGTINVGIPKNRGFHTRPSILVAKIVQYYGGQVELVVGEDRFDAGSVLDIQWAGGKIQNEDIEEVIFEGDIRALADIEILSSMNYCEDTMGKGIPFPNELNYLTNMPN